MDSIQGYDVKYELNGQLFIWNSEKAKTNIIKHKITFEEAATLFVDDRTEYFKDKENSDYEERYIAIGLSDKFNILMVCHCVRENDTVTRIISARRADKHEQKRFRR